MWVKIEPTIHPNNLYFTNLALPESFPVMELIQFYENIDDLIRTGDMDIDELALNLRAQGFVKEVI